MAQSAQPARDWREVRRDENQILYLAPATVRKAGDRVKLWALTDYQTPVAGTDQPYLSEMLQKEYDCKEAQFRTLFYSAQSGHMGGGGAVRINVAPEKWAAVPTEGMDETLSKIACGPH